MVEVGPAILVWVLLLFALERGAFDMLADWGKCAAGMQMHWGEEHLAGRDGV